MKSASERFDTIASNYASSEVHQTSPTIKQIHAYLTPVKGISVCDVACGAGHTALSFASIANRIVGVDDSPTMLAVFKSLAETQRLKVETVKAKAELIPLPDKSFDIVISRLAAHHFADIYKALREMARVLKDTGKLVIIDLEGNENPEDDELNHRLEVLHDPTHIRSYTAGQWRLMIEQTGLQIELFEPKQSEFPEGVPVSRWCQIASSGKIAEKEILRLLDDASKKTLASLGITFSEGIYKMPIRTVLIIACKST